MDNLNNPQTPTDAEDKPKPDDGQQPGDGYDLEKLFADEAFLNALKNAKPFQQIVAKYRKTAKEAQAEAERLRKEREDAERAKLEEQKKYQELYKKAEEEKAAIAEELSRLRAARIADIKRAALLDAAQAHKPPFASLQDVKDYIAAHNLLEQIEIDDDDNIVTDVNAIIAKIAEERAHWLKTDRSDGGVPGYKPGGNQRPDLDNIKRRYGIP